MLVGEFMSKDPITVTKDTGVYEALNLMREKKIRRLPVLDEKGKLVGIVSEKDLLYASPSPATSLSIYEIRYLLSKLKVSQVMSSPVITIRENDTLEKASRIMVDNKIAGLPVMRGDQVVGMITETDLFKIFLVMLGARQPGIRVTMRVPDVKGELQTVTGAIASVGGNIVSLGTITGEIPGVARILVKVQGVDQKPLEEALRGIGAEIEDVREC
jgi:acetoin utilization protein AcuB